MKTHNYILVRLASSLQVIIISIKISDYFYVFFSVGIFFLVVVNFLSLAQLM